MLEVDMREGDLHLDRMPRADCRAHPEHRLFLADVLPTLQRVAERISPNALLALKDALASAFWAKKDLLAFLAAAIDDRRLLDPYDWLGPAYKRDTVSQFVDRLAARQDLHRDRLVRLMSDVARKEDFPELTWHEDAERLIEKACASRDEPGWV